MALLGGALGGLFSSAQAASPYQFSQAQLQAQSQGGGSYITSYGMAPVYTSQCDGRILTDREWLDRRVDEIRARL